MAALYTAAVSSVFLGVIFSAMAAWNQWFAPRPAEGSVGLLVLAVGLAFTMLGALVALRIEAVRFLGLVQAGFAMLTIPLVVILLGGAPTLGFGVLAAVAVLGVIATRWLVQWLERPDPEVPDVLAGTFGGRDLYESNGVQFQAIATTAIVPGQPGALEVHLQNCVDAPRTVTLELSFRNLILPRQRTLELKPLEAGVARLPFLLTGATNAGRAACSSRCAWRDAAALADAGSAA